MVDSVFRNAANWSATLNKVHARGTIHGAVVMEILYYAFQHLQTLQSTKKLVDGSGTFIHRTLTENISERTFLSLMASKKVQ